MINRRIIRGKVLQQLFAYKTCCAANLEITQEAVIQHFSSVLNPDFSGEDSKKLDGYGKMTLVGLEEYVRTNKVDQDNGPEEINSALRTFTNQYNTYNQNDRRLILKKMISDTEKIFDYYLMTLQILIEAAHKISSIRKNDRLWNNPILQKLDNSALLKNEISRHHISWNNDQDIVNEVVTYILDSKEFITYSATVNLSFEEERKMLLHIAKNLVLKNPNLNDHFEIIDLNWDEDKVAVKDMVDDTIKAVSETEDFTLATISKNWEDDKEFMKALFENTLDNENEYEDYISPQLKNWDISRLTGTDNILMKMCVSEMINFSNIPVKVSINEYIELSKRYSTPKSKMLINGVLDNLSQKLIKDKIIRKSGRGLMDNK
ncbi:MAG: transcription antitermination factor NusB [Bacteroidota bacterium]|nr:transcription antitermination factor NusB [Bacteroidota bacterium]